MERKQTVDFIKSWVIPLGGIGVAAIVTTATGKLCPTAGMGFLKKIPIALGTAMFSGMAAHASCEYTSEKFTELMDVDEEPKKSEDDSEKEEKTE